MSIMDRFPDLGEWTVGKDSNIQFSSKILKTYPRTKIEVRKDGTKVTGQSFLTQILKEIAANSEISNKLKELKNNESVKIIFAGRGEYVLSKAAKSDSVTARTIRASFIITNNNPPPIDRSTKPKNIQKSSQKPEPAKPKPTVSKPALSKNEQKKDAAETRDMWNTLHEKGEVEL